MHRVPTTFTRLLQKSDDMGFTMPSDTEVGKLLQSLVAAKPAGRFLELGTGMGLSLSWMVAGMDEASEIISIDNDPKLIRIVAPEFQEDSRVNIHCMDGAEWITTYEGPPFDLIFADAWPGKYELLAETMALVKAGGMYLVDDMSEQPNWPSGHAEKAHKLSETLVRLEGWAVTRLDWSSGVILCTKGFTRP